MKHTLPIIVSISVFLTFFGVVPAGMAQKPGPRPTTGAAFKAHTDQAESVFGAAQAYAAGFGGASQSVAADFNGDGVPDIAVVNACDLSYCGAGYASVAVMIGRGDGTFKAPVIYATASFEPMSVAAGDV